MSKGDELTIRGELLEAAQERELIAAARELYTKMEEDEIPRNRIWPALDPTDPDTKPELRLVPLERLGGEAGRSGNRVVAGYFLDLAQPGLFASAPMVIKVSPAPEVRESSRLKSELQMEYDNVKRLSAFVTSSQFAAPFDLYPGTDPDSPAVLWAPLTSATNWWAGSANARRLQVVELWKALSTASKGLGAAVPGDLASVLDSVYRLVAPLHLGDGRHVVASTNLVEHYKWELRRVEARDDWSKPWRDLWGEDSQEQTSDLGDDAWMNPFFVLDKLKSHQAELHLGVVHGDLHPKNIVFSHDHIAHIIDFGWFRDKQHVAKDFVLLECNLRFVTLPPSTPMAAICKMGQWIDMDFPAPALEDIECQTRVGLISRLREKARQHMPGVKSWDSEYVVPLFLVALGLMKHCHQAECQIAARYTVLSLAKYVWESVLCTGD